VILLTTLSAVSLPDGRRPRGFVMALMVALSVGLRFFQESGQMRRAEAQGHDPRDRTSYVTGTRRNTTPGIGAR